MALSTLLRFCDFLEDRVHTKSLPLFRRMLRDFHDGNEHTLQDFMRLGAAVVAVLPIPLKSQSRLQDANQLLAHQRNEFAVTRGQTMSPHTPCVFQYLLARVATKNILWLRDIFQQFCRGDDSMLKEFVRRGNEVISLIPIDIAAIRQMPMAPQMTSYALAMSWTAGRPPQLPMPVLGKRLRDEELRLEAGASEEQAVKRVRRKATGSKRSLETEGDAVGDDHSGSEVGMETELAPQSLKTRRKNQVVASITQAMRRLEAQEPWNQVFKPDAMTFPFIRNKHPKLAAALKKFWTKHARAVWERNFRGPSATDAARRSRQSKALHAFRMVMRLAHDEVGAVFFAQLDQRKVRHPGWWYMRPVQSLTSIANSVGLAKCLQYIKSQSLARFPVVPGKPWLNTPERGKSLSMWSENSNMQDILRDINAFKAAARSEPTK